MKNIVKRALSKLRMSGDLPAEIRKLQDLVLREQTMRIRREHANPLNGFGNKCFSQSDEDGITLEILRRIDALGAGVFAEFGVGNGMENNTLILAALGWKGLWVGGEDLLFDTSSHAKNAFSYTKAWVTRENIVALCRAGLRQIGAAKVDVISLDLDGNDIYLVEALLEHDCRPKLFIVEYNGKFPPPVKFQISYDAAHIWEGDDYFGASLSSFHALFSKFHYRLVCCNSHTGANAFFVDDAFAASFSDVPRDIEKLYVAPRYHLFHSYGHPQSIKVVQKILADI